MLTFTSHQARYRKFCVLIPLISKRPPPYTEDKVNRALPLIYVCSRNPFCFTICNCSSKLIHCMLLFSFWSTSRFRKSMGLIILVWEIIVTAATLKNANRLRLIPNQCYVSITKTYIFRLITTRNCAKMICLTSNPCGMETLTTLLHWQLRIKKRKLHFVTPQNMGVSMTMERLGGWKTTEWVDEKNIS